MINVTNKQILQQSRWSKRNRICTSVRRLHGGRRSEGQNLKDVFRNRLTCAENACHTLLFAQDKCTVKMTVKILGTGAWALTVADMTDESLVPVAKFVSSWGIETERFQLMCVRRKSLLIFSQWAERKNCDRRPNKLRQSAICVLEQKPKQRRRNRLLGFLDHLLLDSWIRDSKSWRWREGNVYSMTLYED